MEVRARALLIRIDLQLRGYRERRHRHLALHPAAFVVVGRRHRWRGHERRVELCRELDLHLARPVTLDLADLVRCATLGLVYLLTSSHLNSSDKAPGSRRRNENGKVERVGARLRRRNDSSVNTICRACRHSMCS